MDFSPGYILGSLLVSGVGFVLYRYGRSQRRMPHAGVGIVMLIYPYFVTDVRAMLLIAGLLCAVLWSTVRFLNL